LKNDHECFDRSSLYSRVSSQIARPPAAVDIDVDAHPLPKTDVGQGGKAIVSRIEWPKIAVIITVVVDVISPTVEASARRE
jgi:hypothetical protein